MRIKRKVGAKKLTAIKQKRIAGMVQGAGARNEMAVNKFAHRKARARKAGVTIGGMKKTKGRLSPLAGPRY